MVKLSSLIRSIYLFSTDRSNTYQFCNCKSSHINCCFVEPRPYLLVLYAEAVSEAAAATYRQIGDSRMLYQKITIPRKRTQPSPCTRFVNITHTISFIVLNLNIQTDAEIKDKIEMRQSTYWTKYKIIRLVHVHARILIYYVSFTFFKLGGKIHTLEVCVLSAAKWSGEWNWKHHHQGYASLKDGININENNIREHRYLHTNVGV